MTKNFSIGLLLTYRFLPEIINAVLHGDLRPPNILIDRDGHVSLCDFDDICMIGQHIHVGNNSYCEQSETGSFSIAEAGSEQGAIGCCAFFISTGTEPQNIYQAASQSRIW